MRHKLSSKKISFFLFCSLSLRTLIFADEWSGESYQHNSTVQLSQGERLLKVLTLKGDEDILDIGCGNGVLTSSLAKRIPKGSIIGIDPSESMLSKARENIYHNLIFYQGSAETYQFNRRFDHIFATYVMHWIENQEIALKNIYNHLKPDGKVHLIISASKQGLPFHRALLKTIENWEEDFEGFVNSQREYDLETYRKLMVNSGLHIDAFHYVYDESTHENIGKLKAWVKEWLPHGKYLPEEKRESFFDELFDNYLVEAGYPLPTTGAIKWGEYTLIVHGRKLMSEDTSSCQDVP